MNISEDLFSKICRICLSVNNTKTVPLFDNNEDLSCYGQAVSSCSNTKLSHLEYAPMNMCYGCLHELRQCIVFQKKCRSSQKYFEKNNFSHLNVKENIINQLYSNSSIVNDDKMFKNINDKGRNVKATSIFDSNKSTDNKIHVELIIEPLSSFDTNNSIKEQIICTKPKTNNNVNKWSDNNIDDAQTSYDSNDFKNNDSSDYELFNLMENCIQEKDKKVKFKEESEQESDSKNDVIFNLIEEICDNNRAEDKVEDSKLPDKDVEDKETNELNKSLLEIEINCDNANVKKSSIADVLFKSIEEALDDEVVKQKDRYKSQNKSTIEKTIENYKKTIKILSNQNLESLKINSELNESISSIKSNLNTNTQQNEKLKEERLAMKYLKISKDAKVKFRSKIKRGVLKKNKMKKQEEFTCTTCDRTFKCKNTWLRHSERHAGITPFICELCAKGFVTKNELQVHLVLTHGTGRHYPCEQCGYKAPRPYDLREHMRLHTGERPYACDQCGLTFRRLYILRQHQICHTEKKLQCPKCPLRFYKLTNLRAHDNNVHSRRYMFVCELCSRQYARNKTVRQHLAKVHGVPREKQGKIKKVYINETPMSQPALEVPTNTDSNAQMQ